MEKVSISKCPGYDLALLTAGIDQCIELLGGWAKIASPEDNVLIKPNLLRALPPDSGVDTHPAVIRALILLLQQKVGCRITVGDSSGERFYEMKEVWRISGMNEAVRGTTAVLVNLCDAKEIEIPNGKIFKKIPIAKAVLAADVIISVPKLKTHDITLITAGVKNLLGVVPGLFKLRFHKEARNPLDFGEALADILSVVRPNLTLVDGIVSMEGDGPVKGNLRKTGSLLAGYDPVAVDTVISYMIGVNPLHVPAILACRKRGIGTSSIKDINILGEKITNKFFQNFKLPGNALSMMLPQALVKLAWKGIMVKPIVNLKKCRECLVCQNSCPVKAIKVDLKNPGIFFNYAICIRCLCCYELCPDQAITPGQSLLARIYFSKLIKKVLSVLEFMLKKVIRQRRRQHEYPH